MKITREEAAGLWHAVAYFGDMLRALPSIEGITPAQIEAETRRLAAARSALRKVQAARRAAKRECGR